jgi:hypothetical protein
MSRGHETCLAHCIGCGCHDLHACESGCWWLKVDYAAGSGVCSECESYLAAWEAGQRIGPGLGTHIPGFKKIVLRHLQDHVPQDEWARLRELSLTRKGPHPAEERVPNVTVEQLVELAVSEDSLPLRELMNGFVKESGEIGQLLGQPVYYFTSRGIYAWSVSLDAPSMLSLWVTHLAYPPGW